MRLLLDTHVAVWAVTEPEKLSTSVRSWVIDPENEVWFGLVSLWEIAIKRTTGRERADMPMLSTKDTWSAFADADFDLLSITPEHITWVEGLERHHGDPFDRLLVAQAQLEGLTLVTHDKALAPYGDFVMII